MHAVWARAGAVGWLGLPGVAPQLLEVAALLSLHQMYSFQASLGWLDLQDAVKKEFGETHKYTALVPDLSGGC